MGPGATRPPWAQGPELGLDASGVGMDSPRFASAEGLPMKTRRSLVLGATLLGSATAFATAVAPLQVSLSLPQAVVQGEGAVWVEVQVHNPGPRAVKVLRWQLPEGELHGPLFEVLDAQGRAADYTGPLVKRPAPRAEDFVRIAPGQTLSYRVDLGARYALGDGQYQVRYRGLSADARVGELRSGAAVPLWTTGRAALPQALAPQGIDPAVGPIVYTGACTARHCAWRGPPEGTGTATHSSPGRNSSSSIAKPWRRTRASSASSALAAVSVRGV